MRQFQQYKEGIIMGTHGVIFIKEIDPIPRKCGRVRRMANFRCSCGNIFNAIIESVRKDHTTSCGCLRTMHIVEAVRTHGLYKHPMYSIWANIKERTTNVNYKHYRNYGARGIIMWSPWKEDFKLFFDYISALPDYGTPKYTLDRIDNDGNYVPGNLRWTTRHIQNMNRRKKIKIINK